jgi:hypothetical protein
LTINHCNIFGFRVKSGYLNFDHWTGCVDYYKTWQDKYYKGGDYYEFLRDIGYAEDTNYINKLKSLRGL